MKKTVLLTVSAFLFFTGTFVYGSTVMIYNTPESVGISVPERAREYASEEDLVEMICYEAKWKGGEGVARVEALQQLLSSTISGMSDIGLSAMDFDLGEKSQEMRSKIEAVCLSSTVDQAVDKVGEYKSFAQRLRVDLQGDFTEELRELENTLTEKGEDLKEKIEKELGKEAESLAQNAERRLREKGEQEAVSLEAQIRELANEFEEFMGRGEVGPEEARSKANQLAGRISADSETTSFLSSKFTEILSEALGLFDRAASGELSPAQIRSMAMQRVPGVVAEIRSFMTEKYENMARDEEKRIREALEEKAEEIGGEERARLEEIRDTFHSFESDLERLFTEKMAEWNEYEFKIFEKRVEIITKAVESHFNEAKKIIEEKRDQIDMAIEEGVAVDFGILSYEQLVADLESDKQEIIQELALGDLTEASISSIQRKFTDKWKDYQKKMEVIEMKSPQIVIEMIMERYDINQHIEEVKQRIETEKARGERGAERVNRMFKRCEEYPTIVNNPRGNMWDDATSSTHTSVCATCRSKDFFTEFFEVSKGLYETSLFYLESLESLRSRLLDYTQNAPQTMEEALAFRDELMSAGNDMEQAEKEYRELARRSPLAENRDICWEIRRR